MQVRIEDVSPVEKKMFVEIPWETVSEKLERYGLGDLIEPGEPQGGEPTYRMRR